MGKSEKELHTAVLSVPLPICIINEQGKVIGASDQISQVFLYDMRLAIYRIIITPPRSGIKGVSMVLTLRQRRKDDR